MLLPAVGARCAPLDRQIAPLLYQVLRQVFVDLIHVARHADEMSKRMGLVVFFKARGAVAHGLHFIRFCRCHRRESVAKRCPARRISYLGEVVVIGAGVGGHSTLRRRRSWGRFAPPSGASAGNVSRRRG
jgi:hypothetical protein